MYANVVILHYKSPEATEQGIETLSRFSDDLLDLAGFQEWTLVRTGVQETVQVGRFETAENASDARERMRPRLMDAIGHLLEGDPDLRFGPVPLVRSPAAAAPRP